MQMFFFLVLLVDASQSISRPVAFAVKMCRPALVGVLALGDVAGIATVAFYFHVITSENNLCL